MVNIEKLQVDYNTFAKKCIEKGINPSDIFTKPIGVNKTLFNSVLKIFNNNLKEATADERKVVFDKLIQSYQEVSDDVIELDCGRSGKLILDKVGYKNNFIDFMKVMKEFNNGGYFINDGTKLNLMAVNAELESLGPVNKLVGKSKEKLYEGVITTDGKFYVSLSEHTGLCMYLNASGVDLKGALRITQMPGGQRTFSLSSLHYLSYIIKSVEDDKNIVLTDEQAQSLYKFFKAIKSENKGGGQTLLSIFMRSVGLGWDFMNFSMEDINISLKHARRNLETLQDNSEGEFDGTGLYKKIVEYTRELGLLQAQ